MNNILVTGANGQLGSEIRDLSGSYSDCNFIFTDVAELDITNHKAVSQFIKNNSISTIINCAAYTAVDKAETETEISNQINNLAAANFASLAKENNIKLVHISTDYVFDGTSNIPYVEDVQPNPQSVYGKTKLEGENAVLNINPKNSIIIRTSWVYSSYGNNFVKTMLRLGAERDSLNIVADQVGTPTYAKDLANAILNILPKINNNIVEVFHFSNEGVCSWYDFAKAIFELKHMPIKVSPIASNQYPTPAKRPYYSVLNKSKIKEKYQIEIPYWKDSLIECLNKLG
jgi:dTDP-4-dehydrorhamnose reductase